MHAASIATSTSSNIVDAAVGVGIAWALAASIVAGFFALLRRHERRLLERERRERDS